MASLGLQSERTCGARQIVASFGHVSIWALWSLWSLCCSDDVKERQGEELQLCLNDVVIAASVPS